MDPGTEIELIAFVAWKIHTMDMAGLLNMKSLTGPEIIAYLSTHKGQLYDQFGVLRIGVFGSCAHGTLSHDSDVDMVVEFESASRNIHNFLSLKRFLENELGRKVDLGFEKSLKPAVKERIMGQIVYA